MLDSRTSCALATRIQMAPPTEVNMTTKQNVTQTCEQTREGLRVNPRFDRLRQIRGWRARQAVGTLLGFGRDAVVAQPAIIGDGLPVECVEHDKRKRLKDPGRPVDPVLQTIRSTWQPRRRRVGETAPVGLDAGLHEEADEHVPACEARSAHQPGS